MTKRPWQVVLLAASVGACSGVGSDPEPRAIVHSLSELSPIAGARRAPGGDPAAESLSLLRGRRVALGLSSDDDFEVLSARRGADKLEHVRLRQMHDGVPIWEGDQVVHMNDHDFVGAGGNVVSVDGLDTSPAITMADALGTAKRDYAAAASGASAALEYAREKGELVILAGENQRARLVWHVSFFPELQAGREPGLWHYFIDAHDGTQVLSWNGLHTLAQASGPGGNARVARTWTNALDVEASGTHFKMDTARLRTTNMNHGTSGPGTIMTGQLNPFGDAAINDAHGFAEVYLNMLSEWFGHNSVDDSGYKIISRVHYGTNYENAFWDGTQMTYGDGASIFYPLSGDVDVAAHEITHGFTSSHSNLTFSGQSGGLNESFSDIGGALASFYLNGNNGDFDLGRDIFKSSGRALRFMCNPTQDGASIDNAANYTSGLDVHHSSGVMNKAFCRAARRLSSGSPTGAATAAGVKRAGVAWFEANDNYWSAGTNYVSACVGVMRAAQALGFTVAERTAIRDSWNDVGVPNCVPVTP